MEEKSIKRPSKDQYYLKIAREISKRSTCFRARSAAIIVKDDVIVATGYIGAPRKTKDCLERGFCIRDELNIPHGRQYELCRSVHSEQNAIINAARSGANVLGGDMYLYGEKPDGEKFDALPCFICKKMIINAGIDRFIGSTADGSYKVFYIKDWIKDWQKGDIIDDKQQYGADQNKRAGMES